MAWNYGYSINGTALSTYFKTLRILPEQVAPLRSGNLILPWRDGEYQGTSRKWFDPYDLVLDGILRYTDGSGNVTHTDGPAGHVYENRNAVAELLMDTSSTRWLQRSAPHQGDVEIPFEVFSPPTTSDPRHRLVMLLRTLDPFWRDQAARTGLGTSFTLGGSAPVQDWVATFTGGTNPTLAYGTEKIYLTDAMATPIVVDAGAGTIMQGGSPVDAKFDTDEPWWIRLQPGAVALTLTGGGSVSIDLREKWL